MSPILLILAACKPPMKPDLNVLADPSAAEAGESDAARRAREAAVAELVANFARVHFETDSAVLTPAARAALDAKAAILQAHRDVRVEVQGHADERGTIDYNLALGLRRAQVVVDHLVAKGVPPSRLAITSYGEERPLATGADEVAWAENRRAEFRVTSGAPAIRGTTAN